MKNRVFDRVDLSRRQVAAVGGTDAQVRLTQVPDLQELELESDLPQSEEAKEVGIVFQAALELIQDEFEPSTVRAFLLTTVDEVPAAEVARSMSLSVGAVYKAKSRVLLRLRAAFGESGQQ